MHGYELLLGNFLEHAAKWHGSAEVITGSGAGNPPARISYQALYENSRKLSGALLALGLKQGERIATLAWNSHEHMECWYAAVGIGVSYHTLNPRIGVAQLVEMVRRAGDRLLAASADQLDVAVQIVQECRCIEHLVVVDDPDGGRTTPPEDIGVPVWRLADLREGSSMPTPWGGFAEGSESGLCFTSGTIGAPKGVVYSHRAIYLMTLTLLQTDVLGIGSADCVLAVVPMFHANAWGLPYAAPATGARLVLPGQHHDGASLAALIAQERVTVALGVPTVWLGLIDHLDAVGGELPSLQRVVLGGSAIPQALMDRIEQRLGVCAQTSWGMTELAPLGTLMPASAPIRSARLSGRPPAGVDLRLADADGEPLAGQSGAEGHLYVRSASMADRYLGDAEAFTDAQGWFATGDLAVIDDDGTLAITGRAKDLIKSGGEWINPGAMEAIIGALPAIGLVAVVGRPHPKWTERPVLVIELRAGAAVSDAEIVGALEGAVPRWWLPDEIVRVGRMPLALTGKIDKQQLRRRFC
ncbi:MAG: AMP-binding protein [Sphingomonadales bacterium]|nr:AMP-binding protein [Sphingomonadales bacterium]